MGEAVLIIEISTSLNKISGQGGLDLVLIVLARVRLNIARMSAADQKLQIAAYSKYSYFSSRFLQAYT